MSDLVERLEYWLPEPDDTSKGTTITVKDLKAAIDRIEELEVSRIKAIEAIADGNYCLAHLLLQLPPKEVEK